MDKEGPMRLRLSVAAFCALVVSCASAGEFFVAKSGDDANPGTMGKPFLTIQKAADVMAPGDTCVVRGGVYRETVRPGTSGAKDKPIRFVAAEGEKVVLDGTEKMAGPWTVYRGPIYQAKAPERFEQLFVDRAMMIEARWPNMRFEERWDRSKWARAAKGSAHGRMVCPGLAKTGVNWTGALAVLNVCQQFRVWTRPVTRHKAGEGEFSYPADLKPVIDRPGVWDDDFFYLTGKLEALDSPTEWFLDEKTQTLYLWAGDGKSPAAHPVEYKKRTYGFDMEKKQYIEISGFHFFATAFRFDDCEHCLVDHCRLLFPSYTRRIIENEGPTLVHQPVTSGTQLGGANNAVRNTSIVSSANYGLWVNGDHNVVQNCVIHDVNWFGEINYPGIQVRTKTPGQRGDYNTVSRCTVYNLGNEGISFLNGNNVIEYNHVFNGGLACRDIALIYTTNPQVAGSVIHHNWTHASTGIGIRADGYSCRNLTMHHNVIWDCRNGMKMSGDENRIFNNTVFVNNPIFSLMILKGPELKRQEGWPIIEDQNEHTQVFNNAAFRIHTRHSTLARSKGKYADLADGANAANNWTIAPAAAMKLFANAAKGDLRPCEGSPLIDAGRVIEGVTDGFKGKAPDIGAYEFGGEYWTAGADWSDGEIPVARTLEEATAVAEKALGCKAQEADWAAPGGEEF